MTKIPRFRALIADDEPLARRRIRLLLEKHNHITVADECANGEDAVRAIMEHRPDLIFLDVQMPVMDGFEVIAVLGLERMPVVIFVTAYDHYAVKAFDVHAVDYLLKPFDQERFDKALARAVREIETRRSEMPAQVKALMDTLEKEKKIARRLLAKSAGRISILRVDQIDWIEAAGNYVKLHVGRETHMLRESMSGMARRLDRQQFVRIHRSTIVNMERIKELRPYFHGDFVVILEGGTRLSLSRRYSRALIPHFGRLP